MNNSHIKNGLILFILGIVTSFSVAAQNRVSPMKTVTQKIGDNEISIVYSSPSVKKRQIWGDLVPNDKVWRTGANEATTINVTKACTIGGKSIAAGKYALFTIPNEKEWTIIINSDAKQWGAYKYKESKDILRFKAKPEANQKTEMFDISVNEAGLVTIAWDELKVSFEIK